MKLSFLVGTHRVFISGPRDVSEHENVVTDLKCSNTFAPLIELEKQELKQLSKARRAAKILKATFKAAKPRPVLIKRTVSKTYAPKKRVNPISANLKARYLKKQPGHPPTVRPQCSESVQQPEYSPALHQPTNPPASHQQSGYQNPQQSAYLQPARPHRPVQPLPVAFQQPMPQNPTAHNPRSA